MFKIGDTVRIHSHLTESQKHDYSGPGWITPMDVYLGREGKIIDIDKDGDLILDVDNGEKCWRSSWVSLIKPADQPESNENFFIIFNSNGYSDANRKYDKATAIAKAKELAYENPGEVFIIMRTIMSVAGSINVDIIAY